MKIDASFFRRLTLGMGLVGSLIYALEDKRMTQDELVLLLNQLFQGLGAEVDFKGMTMTMRPDGGLNIGIPPEVLKKLEFKI